MTERKAEVIISGNDARLISALKRSEQNVKIWGGKTIDVFLRTGAAVSNFANKHIGALETIGLGVGLTVAAKRAMEFDSALRKIGRTGGLSAANVATLKQDILSISQTIPVSVDQLVGMASALNSTGIPLNMIRSILPSLAMGAKAAGVETEVYASAMGELLDKYQVAASDLPALQDQINEALKMEDVRKDPTSFLRTIEGLSKTMQLMKSQGLGNVTPLLALQAQLTAFTGSSGDAASSLEGLLNGLLRISKNKDINRQLQSRGINFFNSSGGVKNISEIIPEIRKLAQESIKAGKGVDQVAMALFGRPEAAKAIMMIVDKYDDIMKKQESLRASNGSMAKDYKTESDSMTSKLQQFQNQVNKFNIDHVSGVLNKLKTALDFLNAHPLITKGFSTALMGVGGILLINKVVGAVKDFGSLFGKGKGLPGAGGLPVYVTNLPGSVISGGKDPFGLGSNYGGKGRAGMTGALAIAGAYGVASLPVTLPLAAYGLSRGMQQEGTALQKWRAENPGQYATQQSVLGIKPQNHINLSVNIEKDGRLTTESDDMNTSVNVDRGDFGIN